MDLTITGDARQYLALFEEVTGATGRDCLIDGERVLVVVTPGQMSDAIGPGGAHVNRFERRIGKSVRLVEGANDPETFVANALAPAAVYNVTISENEDTVAYVEVASEDRGVAIGKNGQTIEGARTLAKRHVDVDDVQLI